MRTRNTAAHVLALVAFAFAQPVFDVLGQHPTFFVAHDVGRVGLVAFAIAVVLVPTVLVVATIAACRLVSERLARIVRAAAVGILTVAVLLPLFSTFAVDSKAAVLAGCVVCALAGALAYARVAIVGSFLSFVALFGVVAPLLFLAQPPIRPLLADQPVAASGVVVRRPAPIVLVVFDGLRLVELLDGNGRVDAVRYPNFARLADMSTWYRNATTVAAFTHQAVPAILTGRYAAKSQEAPSAGAYPENLFTLLGGAYEQIVYEPVTALCPERFCEDSEAPNARTTRLYEDAAVVWLHVVTPPPWREQLPDVAGRWTGFAAAGATRKPRHFEHALASEDRSAAFTRSLERLARSTRMPL